NYVQESESDGCDEESFSSEGDDMSEVIEWTAENIHKVVKETEDTLDHGESDCNNEEVQEAGNRTIERENTIADVTDDALEDLPCTRGLKDSDCVFDDKYENVFIKGFRKENAKSKHNRVYDCVHACVFCFKLFTNIQCHLEHKHSNQAQMKVIREKKLAIEVSVEEMKKTLNGDLKAKLNLLRNKGDNLHNLKVLKHKQGELLVKRRTTNNEKFSLDDYGPCPNCEEWFLLRMSLTNHQKVCPAKKEEEFHKGTTMIQIAVLTGRLTQTGSKILKSEVFPGMKKDQIGITAIEDSLITALGDCWLMKNIDNKRKRRHYASFHMRLAARLLSAFRNMTGERTTTVDKMLIPDNFDQITECALQICNTNNDSDEYDAYQLEHPSTAIKAGFDIMRLASAKLGLAIKVGNAIARQEATDFINLMKLEWNVRVTKLATSLLSERRFNTKKELPHPVDIMKFATFLVDELKALDLNISDGEKFQTTAALVQTRLLLYNRRRPGELEALRLVFYHCFPFIV
ncbi:MAG: hypothetical protein ABW185_26180, partial [Sedimenticola sp.]